MCKCPTCGSEIHPDSILVSLNTNTVTTVVGAVRLQPMQAEIASVLAKNSPQYTHMDDIINAVYGRSREPPSEESIRTRIKDMRRKLSGIGVKIECVYFRGYRIALAERQAEAA
jgi:DNA-binding response OmpR family regulator